MQLRTNLDNEIAAKIEICLQSMASDSHLPSEGPYKFFVAEGLPFELDRDGARAYQDIIYLLKQRGELDQEFSDKEIRRQVQQLLGRIYVKHGEKALRKAIKHEFRSWWHELQLLPVKQVTHYYVVEGVSLTQEICIGAAQIQCLGIERYEAFGQQLFDRVDANMYYCSSAKHLQKQSFIQTWMPHFEPDGQRPLLLVSVIVRQRDAEFGRIAARAIIDELVDFLRFLALQEQSDLQLPVLVAVRNQMGNQLSISFAAYDDGGWQLAAHHDGMSNVVLKTIPPQLLAFFGAALAKNERDRNHIENKLVRAMIYLGKAAAELLPTNQLLYSWFSLETIVQNQGDRTKGDVLCARIAALLSNDATNFEQQKKLVGRAYSVRNRIVHQGVSRLSQGEQRLIAQVKQRSFFVILMLADVAVREEWSDANHLAEYVAECLTTLGKSA